MKTPSEVRYLIRWYEKVVEDGEDQLVPVSKFVILGGVEEDDDAKRRFVGWNRENPDPFMGRPNILGPFLYKTVRII